MTRKHKPLPGEPQAEAISDLKSGAQPPIQQYAYRSLDRQWILADARLADRPRPPLWSSNSDQQVYLTCFLTGVLGEGPAAIATDLVPDLDHFRGSFGAKHVIPLWRDGSRSNPNVASGLLDKLSSVCGAPISPEDLLSYCYAILSNPYYTDRFSEELTIPGPRVPFCRDKDVFMRGVDLGRQLIRLHTYGQRMALTPMDVGKIPQGSARNTKGIDTDPTMYPETFSYDFDTETLHVGDGTFSPVSLEIWDYSISGLEVVGSWLSYRKKSGAGRTSSPLDEIRPEAWTAQMSEELLRLRWILEATINLQQQLEIFLDEVTAGDTFNIADMPTPSDDEREPPEVLADGGAIQDQLTFEDGTAGE